MRKNILVILVLFTFVFFTGCNKKIASENTTAVKSGNSKVQNNNLKSSIATPKIENYYPFEKNMKYSYVGNGNEYATYYDNVDYVSANREQIRTNNGGTETVKVIENKDGELRLIFSKSEIYYRENFTLKNNAKPEILLKEPLIKGNSWTLLDGSVRSITNVNVVITTPLGNYKCIEVSTVIKDSVVKDYYAPNIGLVKTIFESNGTKVSSSLSKIEKNVSFVQIVKFYFPNGNDGINYITNEKLSFSTNYITKAIFEKVFKEVPNKNVEKVISPNTKIKSLYLNVDGMVHVDFSKEFTGEMNAGSGYESQILQCITNTLGDYYMVKKVYITVEGKPYSSGHILMKKGEAFIVDYKNTK